MLARVLPPGRKRLSVVVGAVFIIEEPQTEARTSHSEWPDFSILSVAANGSSFPLSVEVRGNIGMRPSKGMFAIPDHFEWLVPAIIANHCPDPEQN